MESSSPRRPLVLCLGEKPLGLFQTQPQQRGRPPLQPERQPRGRKSVPGSLAPGPRAAPPPPHLSGFSSWTGAPSARQGWGLRGPARVLLRRRLSGNLEDASRPLLLHKALGSRRPLPGWNARDTRASSRRGAARPARAPLPRRSFVPRSRRYTSALSECGREGRYGRSCSAPPARPAPARRPSPTFQPGRSGRVAAAAVGTWPVSPTPRVSGRAAKRNSPRRPRARRPHPSCGLRAFLPGAGEHAPA